MYNQLATRRRANALQGTSQNSYQPQANIIENENDWKLELLIPGFTKSEIKMAIENDLLVITAEGKESEVKYRRHEFHSGSKSVNRSFKLNDKIDRDKIEAELNNGILTITLPIAEEAKAREISIS